MKMMTSTTSDSKYLRGSERREEIRSNFREGERNAGEKRIGSYFSYIKVLLDKTGERIYPESRR